MNLRPSIVKDKWKKAARDRMQIQHGALLHLSQSCKNPVGCSDTWAISAFTERLLGAIGSSKSLLGRERARDLSVGLNHILLFTGQGLPLEC